MIEATIEKLTLAINRNAKATEDLVSFLQSGAFFCPDITATEKNPEQVVKPEPEQAKQEPEKQEQAKQEPEKQEPEKQEQAKKEPEPEKAKEETPKDKTKGAGAKLTLDDLRNKVNEILAEDPKTLQTIVSKIQEVTGGKKKLTDMSKDQYPEFMEALNEITDSVNA